MRRPALCTGFCCSVVPEAGEAVEVVVVVGAVVVGEALLLAVVVATESPVAVGKFKNRE